MTTAPSTIGGTCTKCGLPNAGIQARPSAVAWNDVLGIACIRSAKD